MKYNLDWIEQKITSTGKTYYVANVTDAHGIKTMGAKLWEKSWPNKEALMAGMSVEADLVPSDNPKFPAPTLYPAKSWGSKSLGGSGFNASKQSGIKVAMEQKQEGIRQFQENKEHGIKVSSTLKMAVDIVIARGIDSLTVSTEETQDNIKYWREWLWKEWFKEEKDFDPF